MELVSQDMKRRGVFIARTLNLSGATYAVEKVPLSDTFKNLYDDSVQLVSDKHLI